MADQVDRSWDTLSSWMVATSTVLAVKRVGGVSYVQVVNAAFVRICRPIPCEATIKWFEPYELVLPTLVFVGRTRDVCCSRRTARSPACRYPASLTDPPGFMSPPPNSVWYLSHIRVQEAGCRRYRRTADCQSLKYQLGFSLYHVVCLRGPCDSGFSYILQLDIIPRTVLTTI